MQTKILKLLNKRHIAIETPPTSNVRISYYDFYHQHHIFRWFHPDPKKRGKVVPFVCVGTDDPGIFATNLRGEFSHLYQAAIENGASVRDTVAWLKELNQNARTFRF